MDQPNISPDTTPPTEDVGADTQRRFRHQAAYTAIVALGLLEDGPLREIYREHHDDIVLRPVPPRPRSSSMNCGSCANITSFRESAKNILTFFKAQNILDQRVIKRIL
jgi:hypothetical protein